MRKSVIRQSGWKDTEFGPFNQPTSPPAPDRFLETTPPEFYESSNIKWRLVILSLGLIIAVISGVLYGPAFLSVSASQQSVVKEESRREIIPLTPTSTPTPTITPSPTPGPKSLSFLESTPIPTPVSGGRILILSPAPRDVGWVVSEDEGDFYAYSNLNHFGDSFMYAGILNGKIYHGAFQFDLSQVPRGTEVQAASLRLTGLRTNQMAEQGEWRVQLLSPAIDPRWSEHNYAQIHEARVLSTFQPVLTPEQLAQDQENVFEFTPEQVDLLERRIYEGNDNFERKISFRIDGPLMGKNNLFAWDSGYGPASRGQDAGPELFLSLGPPPEDPPQPYYVIITSTPTPQDIKTAVAISLQQTAEAKQFGTATPRPPYWVTPHVVTVTPTAENEATAQVMKELATAIALTTGEPPYVVTATSTPTYVIITATPTPESILTAAAQALQVTAQASQSGTATPFPPNWVTPVVVTPTPMPQNTATAEYLVAVMLTTGTPTHVPANLQTATPTPVFITQELVAPPTATATPTATAQRVPEILMGKIVFLSDREGATEQELLRAGKLNVTPTVTPQPYVYDLETGQLGRLTDIWPYEVVAARDSWSADTNFESYTMELLWGRRTKNTPIDLEIHYYDYTYNVERMVTQMGAGIVYDPAWSPVSNEIAFVGTETQNDEIWVIQHDGTDVRQLTHNEWEWDKHPSWSPDGQKIVFYSNRTGNNQLWIMNKDGSNQQLLMPWNPYNDFDPIWVKYLEPVPPLARQPDWRFLKPEAEVQNSR